LARSTRSASRRTVAAAVPSLRSGREVVVRDGPALVRVPEDALERGDVAAVVEVGRVQVEAQELAAARGAGAQDQR
jgi:hypothetical protein